MPMVDSSIVKPKADTASETSLAATWSAVPTTARGTSHSHGLR